MFRDGSRGVGFGPHFGSIFELGYIEACFGRGRGVGLALPYGQGFAPVEIAAGWGRVAVLT